MQGNSVNFDTNFYEGRPLHGEFDPEAIAAFMDEVNDLLSYSTQLLNTDGALLDTFAGKTVAPQDTLGWLGLCKWASALSAWPRAWTATKTRIA